MSVYLYNVLANAMSVFGSGRIGGEDAEVMIRHLSVAFTVRHLWTADHGSSHYMPCSRATGESFWSFGGRVVEAMKFCRLW